VKNRGEKKRMASSSGEWFLAIFPPKNDGTQKKEFYPFGGNLLKPGSLYFRPTADRLVAEELKYSRNRARRRPRATKNLSDVWQNKAIFHGRPIGGAVEAMLTKFVNRRY
jgi:hypothetical protein